MQLLNLDRKSVHQETSEKEGRPRVSNHLLAIPKGSGSYLATADYYFNTNRFRPFVGAGVGVYRNASMDINSDSDTPETSTQFGFAPRAGFELGHFRTAIEYNVAGKSGEISNNYLGIKLGFFFGGGRL